MAEPNDETTPNDAATTELGARPVAPRTDQVIDLLARYLVVVVVRDRTGSPLAGASVTVTVDDTPLPTRETDAQGLVEPPFVVLPQRQIKVVAKLRPLPEKPIVPGSLRMTPAEVILSLAALEERARPPVAWGFEPAWPDLGAVKKVLFLTLQPRCWYRMRRHFPWQNPALREQIFRKDPQEHSDPGQRTATGELAVAPNRDRKQRLRDFIRYYAGRIPGAQSLSDYVERRGALARRTPELDAIARSQLDEEIFAAHLARVERRLEWLMVHGIPRKGSPPPSPIAPPGGSDAPEGSRPREEPEDVVDAKDDVGAGQRKEDFGDDPPAYADPSWTDIDTSSPKKEAVSLRRRRDRMIARGKTLGVKESTLTDAALAALTHRELLEYILFEIFDKDPKGERFPGWARYAVLHFSGLRYAGASGSYYPVEELLRTLREQEMAAERSVSLDKHRLAIFLEEHASLLLADKDLQGGIYSRGDRTAAAKGRPFPTESAAGKLFAARAAVRGEAQGKAAVDDATARKTLDETQATFVKHWIRRLNDEKLRRDSRSAASGDEAPPDNPLTDAWGLVLLARETERFPAEAWPAIVQYTELRNDFVNVHAVDHRPPPKKEKPSDPDPVIQPPPPPFDGSPWPVSCPSLEGSIIREYGAKFPGLFRDRLWGRWKAQHAGDLSLVVSRAVCNQIAEMLAAARNIDLGGGIPANSQAVDSGESQIDVVAPVEREAFETDAEAEETRELLLQAARISGAVNHFTLATSSVHTKRGDFMFFLEWRPLGTKDQWGWATPFLNIPYFELAVRSQDEPCPRTQKEIEADEEAYRASVSEWQKRGAAWKKKVAEATAARKKAESIARNAAARERPPRKIPPAKPPASGHFPGEEPFPEPKPTRPAPPPGSVLRVERHSKKGDKPVFTANGHPLPVIESWDDPRVKRGAGARPRTPVAFECPASLPSHLATPWSQLALLRTELPKDHSLGYVFVRRHPRTDVYTEVLGWQHIATILEPPREHGRILTFETYAPTGVAARTLRRDDPDRWSYLLGHMVTQDESVRHLEAYLSPALLLDERALPKSEDK